MTAHQGIHWIERIFPHFIIRVFPVQPTFGIHRGSRSGDIGIYERRLAEQAFSYAGGAVEEFGNLSKPGIHAGAVNYSQIREVIGKRRNAQAVADALRAEKADEERILDIEIAASDEKATEAEISAEGDR